MPVESLLKPNQKQAFRVRLYNAKGQYLKDAPAKFTVEGTGTIDSAGNFLTATTHTHSVSTIKAEVDGLTATARVRTIPHLPWKFDFADQKVPPVWIGANGRHQPREVDGEALLAKVTTIPKGTRSQSWMGPTDLHDYTIQADLRADEKNGKTPEMGLINQRYTMVMIGSQQVLQLRSWTPRLELRFAKTVPFEWKPKTWYVMKFQAENLRSAPDAPVTKVILRGKVWPRGEKEPAEWSIEGEDAVPNTTGSPGLFGNSSDAEVFYDNVLVIPNAPSAP